MLNLLEEVQDIFVKIHHQETTGLRPMVRSTGFWNPVGFIFEIPGPAGY